MEDIIFTYPLPNWLYFTLGYIIGVMVVYFSQRKTIKNLKSKITELHKIITNLSKGFDDPD